jgi:two-component system OmpR family sensor kinase
MRLLPRTLTARLVVVAVALVAVVGVLVATSATLAMRGYLYSKKDAEVADALRRADDGPRYRVDGDGLPDGAGARSSIPLVEPDSVVVFTPVAGGAALGVIAQRRPEAGGNGLTQLSTATVAHLTKVPADAHAHSVTIAGSSYRAMATVDQNGNPVVIGLAARDIDDTVTNMVAWFALLTLLGVGVAGVAGTWLVRRQLHPLHAVAETAREVSTQDLSSGETTISTRVGADLTDEQTEVGQVGSALNTLLDHVDAALAARHRSEQQVRQFVADASHELRTPLSTIHGYAELSRRTPDDPAVLATALSKVETEADRMSALVEDLLLLARLDAGRPLAREEVDLTRLLLEAVADARVLAPDHQWRLELPEEPVTATGDEARLHQVVTNLLTNARHHTPAGTTVTVRVHGGPPVRVEVHDDGPGLPEDIVSAAFERFTRGDSSRTRASGGAGLGLSLVSAITEAHGGTAEVDSRRGDTTFTVTLPTR